MQILNEQNKKYSLGGQLKMEQTPNEIANLFKCNFLYYSNLKHNKEKYQPTERKHIKKKLHKQ